MQKPRPAVPTLRDAEAAENTSNVNVDQQLLCKLAGGDGLPNVPLPNVPLPNVILPNAPHLEACPDGSVRKERSSPRVAEKAMIVVFRFWSGSCPVRFLCSNLFLSGIQYCTCHQVFGSLRVYFIYWFCIGFILFIVVSDIAHAAFLKLRACKEPPCDGVESQYISQVS